MKKYMSHDLKSLIIPFTVVGGVSLFSWLLCYFMDYIAYTYDIESNVLEVIYMIFAVVNMILGYICIMGIMPVVITVMLIIISICCAIKEKNIKNILNLYLWGTAVLILVTGFLQYKFLVEAF